MIDLQNKKDVIREINKILNDDDIAEIKRERIGLTVVRIKRKIEYPPKER